MAGAAVLSSVTGGAALVSTLQRDHGVPERAAAAYLAAAQAAACPIDYRILTAIGAVESGHGTSGGTHLDASGVEVDASGRPRPAVSSQGAQGPMQFMPATWARYQVDGNGDGVADVNNVDDAAAAAAKLLCADGVARDATNAVGAYNGGADWQSYAESRDYVAQVGERVAAMPAVDTASSSENAPSPSDKGRICGAQEWLSD